MARPKKPLSREDIERAMRNTLTNRAAARFSRVSYAHYKKYALLYIDPATGKSLYELHLNRSGKGVPKFTYHNENDNWRQKSKKRKEPALIDILEGRTPPYYYTPEKLKYRIMESGMLPSRCARCGFKSRRLVDNRIPLVLIHKNGDKGDYHLTNLELLCYNCTFLEGGINNPLTDKFIQANEDYVEKHGKNGSQQKFELDYYQREFLRNLGLEDKEEPRPGSEYIVRV